MSGDTRARDIREELRAELEDVRDRIRQVARELSSVRSDLIRVALAVGGSPTEEPPAAWNLII